VRHPAGDAERGISVAWPWTFDRFRAEMVERRLEAYELAG
jgi:hypothetical protein